MKSMRKILILALALCLALPLAARSNQLRFHADGQIKIVQLTDLHYVGNKPAAKKVRALVDSVMRIERPDLVVLTGDIVYARPSDRNMREILSYIDSFGVPFCTVFGNHDDEFGVPRSVLYDIAASFENCVNPPRGDAESPDYTVELLSSCGGRVAAVLYCIDSNAHIFDDKGDFVEYDRIHGDQIEAYRARSAAYTQANGGVPLPALGFFHIPLPEYREASASDGAPLYGTRMEACCAPYHNSGMFDAILDCGDIFATFVGHDHDNDYVTMWKGVILCYGRYGGGNTVYNNLQSGARVILLREGERRFGTYVRLASGEVVERAVFPDHFTKSDWRTRTEE